ncbi:MAG: 50S ribosomal protein L13 [Flavobacteriales bacterium TMED113]|nr:MAG: 50S ribosomal protein L13 [Flavobacteriales bacterium TMED113]|tara:strand:+ start:118 stop:561 length:444 start_codon:yes stop_codon:yes gene_type:complete
MEFKTLSANKNTVHKEWLLVDATDEILGRLASKVAKIIRGKYKSNYTPHVDCGDNIVIINAEKIQFSGDKLDQKEYIRHTGYPGGQRSIKAKDLLDKDPTRIIKMAVKGMLPKNKLGSTLNKNLHVYIGPDHKNGGQKPKKIDLKDY